MSEQAIESIHRRVDKHESDIGLLRGAVEGLGREVHRVGEQQTAQTHKLDQIMQALSATTATMQAHKPVNSVDAIVRGISVIKDVVIGVGLLAGGIIFLAQATMNDNGTKTDVAVLKKDVERASAVLERLAGAPQPSGGIADALGRIELRLRDVEDRRTWSAGTTTGALK